MPIARNYGYERGRDRTVSAVYCNLTAYGTGEVWRRAGDGDGEHSRSNTTINCWKVSVYWEQSLKSVSYTTCGVDRTPPNLDSSTVDHLHLGMVCSGTSVDHSTRGMIEGLVTAPGSWRGPVSSGDSEWDRARQRSNIAFAGWEIWRLEGAS